MKNFVRNDSATSIIMGHMINFAILVAITGSIAGVFYLKTEDSSRQAMRIEFTDLGSQIARDVSNMHLISDSGYSSNISIYIKREIPLTIGGKGYRIALNNATSNDTAYIDIIEGSLSGYAITTPINSIDSKINANGIVYSGSGEINIVLTKNNSGEWVWIK